MTQETKANIFMRSPRTCPWQVALRASGLRFYLYKLRVSFGLFGIMRHNLNLDTHIICAKSRDPNTGPEWLVVRHPLLEIPCHCRERFVVHWHVIGVDAEDL